MQIKVAKIDRKGKVNWEDRKLADVEVGEVTVKRLLGALIKNEVELYNRGISKNLPEFISLDKVNKKTGLNWPWRKIKKIEVGEAQEQGILAFGDGLIVMFVDKNKYNKLEETLDLKENSELMISKLTFIATGYDIANWI